ncbi:hypothetical protein ACFV0T_22170 [Streptomyces sp. NPDC059582]
MGPTSSLPPVGAVPRSPGNGSTHTVTLITGDKVTVGIAAGRTVVQARAS